MSKFAVFDPEMVQVIELIGHSLFHMLEKPQGRLTILTRARKENVRASGDENASV